MLDFSVKIRTLMGFESKPKLGVLERNKVLLVLHCFVYLNGKHWIWVLVKMGGVGPDDPEMVYWGLCGWSFKLFGF